MCGLVRDWVDSSTSILEWSLRGLSLRRLGVCVPDDGGVVMATRQLATARKEQLRGSFLALGFRLAPSGEALLLVPIVRARFQFVVLTGVAVEENDLLRIFGLRHGVLTSEKALVARNLESCPPGAVHTSQTP